ncbi:MAG: class I SAM-dependent methyltransferase [Sphingobacteriia bacterium]|nr:class I SAM-dependent methyltransferase [Sphingobacteriia bacterium]
MNKEIIGIQKEGQSPDSIKRMALAAFKELNLPGNLYVADIGAGKGELLHYIEEYCKEITLVDDFDPQINSEKVNFIRANLNEDWNIKPGIFDFVFSLEVIEHIENPRYFIRQIKHILKPGGYAYISTPNNLNIFSRINFLLKGEHRYFQDSCYPAHISCITKVDMKRIVSENDLTMVGYYYNYEDVVPLLGIKLKLPLKIFSNSAGFLIYKSE